MIVLKWSVRDPIARVLRHPNPAVNREEHTDLLGNKCLYERMLRQRQYRSQ